MNTTSFPSDCMFTFGDSLYYKIGGIWQDGVYIGFDYVGNSVNYDIGMVILLNTFFLGLLAISIFRKK